MRYGRIRTALAAFGCLAISGALALAGPAGAAYPGGNGKIAYERNDGTDSEIYVMNADGSAQTNLTNDPDPPNHSADRDPAWSPDGTKIAWARTAEGHLNIFVMNADGTGRINITPGPETTGEANSGIEPTWSPDGSKIAYIHSNEIWVIPSSGGIEAKLVLTQTGLDHSPAWSPDGSRIAFARENDIYAVGGSGGSITNLTNTPFPPSTNVENSPDWSPDSSKIVYTRGQDIWSMNANGTGQTGLTGGTGQCGRLPAWSPDGTKIVFDSSCFTAPNGPDIFVMNADGTGETRIDTGTDSDLDPSWQPVAVPGGYPRPRSASPLQVSLVPAYTQCTSSNRTHGPPLAFASCNPPSQESSQLTVGTPDAPGNGQAASSTGFAKYRVIVGAPGGADDSDVQLMFQLTDVRHQGSLADYTGELQARAILRVTDRLGGPATPPPGEAGTVTDLENNITIPCAATGGTPGATCSSTTTLDALVPGAVPEGKRSIWEFGQVRVNDGGPDGVASTAPNTPFARQGVFIP